MSEKHISRAANDPSVFTITVHREGAFYQENSLVGAISLIVKPMDRLKVYIFAWPASSMITAIRVITVCSTTANK